MTDIKMEALEIVKKYFPKHDDWYCPNCDGDSYRMECICTPARDEVRNIHNTVLNIYSDLEKFLLESGQ